MYHRTHVSVRQEIHNVVFAGFDIHFDFGEARHVGMRHAVSRA
jgi:hypothetical protein